MSNSIIIKNKKSSDPENVIEQYKEKQMYPDRHKSSAIIGGDESSVTLREDGSISINAEEISNLTVLKDKIIKTTTESVSISNREIIESDEIIINNQKMNRQLLDLSDNKVLFDNENDAIGNLMISGTVLVKTWEPNLNKYVLMRRKIRTPMFSSKLNYPTAPELMSLMVDPINNITIDAAILLRDMKIAEEKATAQEQAAEGGSVYDQGEYDNYLSSFMQSSNSISSNKGVDENFISGKIISDNPNNLDYIWPVPEYLGAYTSPYGSRWGTWHAGVDIPPKPSLHKKTKIVAAAAGKVITSRLGRGYGNFIEIDHGNGMITLYAHLSSLLVQVGQEVKQGEHIAFMGCTGDVYSSNGGDGTHLHFEMYGTYQGVTRKRGLSFDPAKFIKPQN